MIVVDLGALKANYALLRERSAPARCAAVVKADGYGLGIAAVSSALREAGCGLFFVATLDEGLELRAHLGPGPDISVLHGVARGCEEACMAAGLIPVLNTRDHVEAWCDTARRMEARPKVHLQIDSGMTRLGLDGSAVLWARDVIGTHLDVSLIMTHLCCASERTAAANGTQLLRFMAAADSFPGVPRSIAASSGIFLEDAYHLDLVRPGAALYGLTPSSEAPNPMRPVVGLRGRVLQLRDVMPGAKVGYGHDETISRRTTLATVAFGYADGLPRTAQGNGAAWFEGVRLPIVGRVSMDSVVLDVGAATLRVGDLVDFAGCDQDIDALATSCGTIGYEILAGLGRRPARLYVDRTETE